MKYKLQYLCKRCGETRITEKSDTWQMIDRPPFIVSKPTANLIIASVGVIVPPMIIWHDCGGGAHGLAEFSGLVPDPEENS
jgi:hypothetical protein